MIKFFEQMGGSIHKREKKRLSRSSYWTGQKFENLEETRMDINPRTLPGLFKKQFTDTENRTPKKTIPVLPFDENSFSTNIGEVKFIWFGHTVILFKINGKTILFDPMFGSDASPIGPIRTKRFSADTLKIIQRLPPIDLVLMSHDHYDHLDMKSIKKLRSKVKQFAVPLGLGRHLKAWGVARTKILEMDWWDSMILDDLIIHFTPSRHFSGRGLLDRSKSLWGGYVIKTPSKRIYISGDGGYGKHFKTIGEKFGPFDFAFVECGQYNEAWHQIHMYPEEAVQAAIDAQAKVAMPIHWGAFKLAMHNWKEPIRRFKESIKDSELKFCAPQLGEMVVIGEKYPSTDWWEEYE